VSVRIRTRVDGSTYAQVRYRHDGRESSASFDDAAEAERFDKLVKQVGPDKALEVARVSTASDLSMTVADWLKHHNDHLTGVDPATISRYNSYADRDINPVLGEIPLRALTTDEIARWINQLAGPDGEPLSGKTIANKHGYLAGALNAASRRGLIGANPCDQTRLPRWDREEMVFLEPDEYAILKAAVPEYWQPLVEFLVTSGCRWSEATALRPGDVDRRGGTVRITKAWKTGAGGYRLGVPKTRKSVRTINIPTEVLDALDFSGDWLFTNSGRGRRNPDGPVRIHSFTPNVWTPAVDRAKDAGLTKRPRIHDLRHTCASWLILGGRPLPAVQAQLGHESIKTTSDVYGHLDRSSGQDNAAVLANALRGRSGSTVSRSGGRIRRQPVKRSAAPKAGSTAPESTPKAL